MRKRWCIALVMVAMALMAPSTAHAGWLGYVARLSGPGPFGGFWVFRVQVMCFMESTNEATLVAEAEQAITLSRLTVQLAPVLGPNLPSAAELDQFSQRTRAVLTSRTMTLKERADLASLAGSYAEKFSSVITADPYVARMLGEARDAWVQAQYAVGEYKAPRTVIGPAVAVNADCTDAGGKVSSTSWPTAREYRRPLASVVVDYRRLGTLKENPDYAGNHEIHMDVVLPRLSWRLFSNPTYDAFNVQTGIGFATFSSEGFDSFTKIVLEPVRLEAHVPTRFTAGDSWKSRLLRVPQYGVGFVMFPQGFEASDFNGTGLGARRIEGKEGVLEQSFVLNLAPLFGL